jgi:hypothetical protein
MLRLYEGEVLNKLPVVQHIVFGSLIRCSWTPTPTVNLPTPPSSSASSFPLSSLPGASYHRPGAGGVPHHGESSSLLSL